MKLLQILEEAKKAKKAGGKWVTVKGTKVFITKDGKRLKGKSAILAGTSSKQFNTSFGKGIKRTKRNPALDSARGKSQSLAIKHRIQKGQTAKNNKDLAKMMDKLHGTSFVKRFHS